MPDELISFAEKQIPNLLKNVTNNQYMVVTLNEIGQVTSAIPYSRAIGLYSLGISRLFTRPYVVVYGKRNVRNEACVRRLTSSLSCEVVDSLIPAVE